MEVSTQITIKAPKSDVWRVISDIERAAERISGIEKVEVLEPPQDGLVGLKWRETRTMFGKTATEVMWITEAKDNEYYETRAESHGSVYRSRLSLAEEGDGTSLTMDFQGEAQSMGAKLMSLAMGWMFKGATAKALQKDLEDIKAAVEKSD